MNKFLAQAQAQIKKLQQSTDSTGTTTTLDLVLVFDRSEEDMKRLVGYPAFAKALEALGGAHTEENIQQACKLSGLNRKSVYFDDMENGEQTPDIHIPIRCDKADARKLIAKNRQNKHYINPID